MIKNFFSARLLVAALCVIVGLEALAEMTLVKPTTPPSILNSDAITMWLDASDMSNFTREGEYVTRWRNIANEDNPAVPKVAASGSDIVYGTVGITNNVCAFKMGAGGSRIELGYNRLTDIRTVFWVMDIVDRMEGGFFLGDTSAINFHRGTGGQYGYSNDTAYFDDEATVVKCDGVIATDKINTHPPTGLHVYSAVMPVNCNSDRLSQDRNQANRNGGRALSELIVLNRDLTDEEVIAVETYLTDKWINGNWGNEIFIDEAQVRLKSITDFMSNNFVGSARLKFSKAAEIVVDAALEDKTLIIDDSQQVSFSLAKGGNVEAFKNIMFLNGIAPLKISNLTGLLRVNDDGSLEIEDTLEIDVPYGEELRLDSLIGGKLVKTGDGTLRIGRVNNTIANVKDTTIEIKAGKVLFHESDGAIFLETSTYILHDGAKLDNYGWPKVDGTLTFESDANATIFTNDGNNTAEFEGNVAIVKRGTGKIELKCGASNDTSHNNVISSVEIEEGTLAFSGNRTKVINAVSGSGTLEQAGGGTMTISKIASKATLKVTVGTLNNECAAGNGSLNLAGLELAAGATYTMKSAIDHLNIAKSFYLEGDAHKNWYVTLGDGALIATDPGNPMTLAGLEFGESVKIGKNQSIDSVLANVIKPKKLPNSVTSEDERFAKISYTLEHEANSLIVASTFSAELATIPGMNLADANYRVYLTNLPAGITSDDLRVRITTPYSSSMTKVNKNGDNWYAQFIPSIQNEAMGGAYQIKVEIGVNDNNAFVPIKTYDDISLNVRPDHKSWIDEASYDRWNTGTWDTEDEYIKIADGYVQIEGKKVSFVPNGKNEEAATKLHFSVKFGAAMKLEILNAIADDGQIAGVTLVEDGGAISYAAWNPAIGEYVPVISSDKKPIDVKAEHLVEVILAKGGIGYIIDGAALVTKGDKQNAVFSLPKDASIKIAEIDFVGQGAVKSMTADEYSTNLAKLGDTEYSTIEEAIAAAGEANRIEVEPLWNASWSPTPELKDKVIVFTGNHKVNPDTTSGILAENDMVLRPNTDGSYSVISKFLIVSIPDTETMGDKFGIFLESVTTNSMHLGWTYKYPDTMAKATVVYDDDVTINFSTTLENNGLMVQREDNSKSFDLKGITFPKVHYDFAVEPMYIPVIDQAPVASQKTLAKFGVAKQDVARAESAGILDFTTASDGVTFTVGLLDKDGNDITKIVSEQIGEMVYFAEKLGDEWKPVGAENVKVITNEDGVQVMFAQQKDTTSGFYKVVIPADK